MSKGMEIGSNWGICDAKHGAIEAAESADDGSAFLPGGCHFRRSKDSSTSNSNNTVNIQRSGHFIQSAELPRKQQYGGSNGTELGRGRSTGQSNEMDVIVAGDSQKTELINEDEGSQGGTGERAVISSGLEGAELSTHPWQQDQGGSSDDMLILYGSPS